MNKEAKELLKALQSKSEQNLGLNIKATSKVVMTAERCAELCAKIGLKYKEGYEKRVVQFRMTDATADRHNEVVVPSGVDLKAFKKDPTILLQHNAWTFPIGKSLETKYDPQHNDVVGKILFFDDETDRSGMSESTFRMVEAGAIKTGSIGFRAKSGDVRMASPEEIKKYKLDKFGVIFDKIELREFSIVTIPANPNATVISSRKGMYTDEALHTLSEKGATDEEINLLKTSDTETDVGDSEPEAEQEPESDVSPHETSTKHNITKGRLNIKMYVHEKDSDKVRREKLDKARFLSEEGHDVDVVLFGKENTTKESIENIEKAGATLSKKNKEKIETALSSLIAVKNDLETVLNITSDNNDDDSKGENPTDQKDSAGEEPDDNIDIYTLVDQMQSVLKK